MRTAPPDTALLKHGSITEKGQERVGSAELWQNAEWFDDWYAIERIDAQSIAIGEPRYWQYQVSYLLLGASRAILFDSGSGKRDIRPVIEALTSLPVTVIFSHAHFDHAGNHHRFDSVAMFDHASLRERVTDGHFWPTLAQYYKVGRPRIAVSEWWEVDETVDLGGRELEIVPVPGHAPESIALLDRERHQLYTGDFIYNGELLVTDLERCLESTTTLISRTDGDETLFGAHGFPRMPYERLEELQRLLRAIQKGEINPKPSFNYLLPQRRVKGGNVDLSLPRLTLLWVPTPFLFVGLIVVLLTLVVALVASWLYVTLFFVIIAVVVYYSIINL